MPAMSRNNLLETWHMANFKIVCDIASSVDFILFYAPYTPHAELHMSKHREVKKLTYKSWVDEIVTQELYKEQDDSIHSLLADQCIACYNSDLRCYLQTDFSSFSFG